MLAKILVILGTSFLIWWTYQAIKRNPEVLSKENLNKSFNTMGILALLLIVVVGLMIAWLRSSH
jgi:cell division protein FtsX